LLHMAYKFTRFFGSLFLWMSLAAGSTLFAQTTVLQDAFDDGDYSANPTWTASDNYSGDATADFIIDTNQLRLSGDSNNGGTAYITNDQAMSTGTWEALITLDFNPSGSNYALYYLFADQQDLDGDLNGYFVLVGDTDDEISLYRQSGSRSSAVKVIDGTNGTVDASTVTVRVKVTRSINGEWQLSYDTAGGTSYTVENASPVTDATYYTARYTGFAAEFTSTRADKMYFDEVNHTQNDLEVTGVTRGGDDQTLHVQFSDSLATGTVNASAFSLDQGVGQPQSVTYSDFRTVELNYASAIGSADYTLSLTGLTDRYGNAPASTSFDFALVFDNPSPGDILINEFMADPPSGYSEYVEVYNPTSKRFNLSNWQLLDDGNQSSLPSDTVRLDAGDYLVFSSDTTSLNSVFGSRSYVKVSGMPSLNNSGDAIVLKNSSGVTIDSLMYSSDWGGSNVALERRSTDVASTLQANWADSPDALKGTPGQTNAVPDDNEAPTLSSVTYRSATELTLVFSEAMDQSTAETSGNYSLSPSIAVSTANLAASDTVQLTLGTALSSGTTYDLTIQNVEDVFGNSQTLTDSFTYWNIQAADSGDVIVNEFLFDPPSGFTEFVEFRNTSAKAIDLSDWTINDNRGFPREKLGDQQLVLPPDSFLVVAAGSDLSTQFPNAYISVNSNFPSLNNSGDNIVLRDPSGVVMDSLTYTTEWGGSGVSVERRSPTVTSTNKANWGDHPTNALASPGNANAISVDDQAPTLQQTLVSDARTIILTFSEGLPSDALTTGDISLSPTVSVSTLATSDDEVTVTLGADLSSATEYTLTVQPPADLFGNQASTPFTDSFVFYQTAAADSGDVHITEFLPDPDNDWTEYVELKNTTGQALDLSQWTINDNGGSPQRIATHSLVVPSDSLAIIAADSTLYQNEGPFIIATMSRFPSLNNSADAIVLKDTAGTLLDSLSYNSDWHMQSGKSLERLASDISAVYPANWKAPEEPRIGSPGRTNQAEPDQIAPTLTQAYVVDGTTVGLRFSESLPPDALTPSDISLDPTVTISSVSINGEQATATLAATLVSETRYSVTVQPPADLFGNRAASAFTDQFIYYQTVPADSGDVLITEFLPDPDDGWTEYIELKNTTDQALDLSQWTIADGTGDPISLASTPLVIPSDSFAVIAADSTLYTSEGPFILTTLNTRFPSLNNSSDAIVLKDTAGQLLDSLTYQSDWQDENGTALERRSVSVASRFAANWGPNPQAIGSPGRANGVLPDQTAPRVTSLSIRNPQRVTLRFSERIDPTTATGSNQIQLEEPYQVTLSAAQEDSVVLMLDQALPEAQNVTLTVGGQQDLFGNTLSDTTLTLRYLDFQKATNFDLVINEILYRKAGTDSPEFVELYNRSDRNLNLDHWIISDGGREASFKTNGMAGIQLLNTPVMEPGDYLVLTDNQQFAQSLDNGVLVSGFPSLNDDEETLVIRNPQQQTIDSVAYTSLWGGNERGVSLERKDPSAPSNDPSNWQSSTSPSGYSAGEQNPSYEQDTTPPSLQFANRVDNQIRVLFSEFIDLSGNTEFTADGTALNVIQYETSQANRVILDASALPSDANLNLEVAHLSDFSGNSTASSSIAIAQPLQPGQVVINEIMFDPIADDNDNLPDQTEYLELVNRSDYTISLEGVTLHDEPDEDGNYSTLDPVTTVGKWIPPGGYVLIQASSRPDFPVTQTARYFGLSDETFALRVDRSTLGLASTEDAIYLADSTGATIDSVYYSESWHNPNLADPQGRSLERVQPGGPSNDPGNWGTSTSPQGGTPTEQNTIYQAAGPQPQNEGISFSPNPFSPDGDGKEDRLTINYTLDESDYLLRVRILDRYGRLTRELANGEPAGSSGTLYWDGKADDGSENRVGIYIVLFEAYDSANGKNRVFKETVVLARQL
jgi:hypothetical protein